MTLQLILRSCQLLLLVQVIHTHKGVSLHIMGSLVPTRQFQPYNGNKNRGKGRFTQGSRFFTSKPSFSSMALVLPNSNSGIFGQSPAQQFRHPSALMVPICQLCNSEGHIAPFCGASPPKRTRCNICGRSNHTS